MRRRGSPWIVPFLFVAVALPSGAVERSVHVTPVFSGRELRIEARVSPDLPRELERRLASGLPATSRWRIALFVARDVWWDGLKDERRYDVTSTFRPVSGDFAVERRLDGRLLETRVVPARAEALEALSRVPALPSFTMGDHLLGKRLVVRVRCSWDVGLALGVVPSTEETAWASSTTFVWGGAPSP